MSTLFYDHLLIIEEIILILDRHNFSPEEKKKYVSLIDQTLNHQIIDVILTHLPKQHHEEFLQKFSHHPHDPRLMHYLKEKTPTDIEMIIFQKADKVKKELIKEIEKHGKK